MSSTGNIAYMKLLQYLLTLIVAVRENLETLYNLIKNEYKFHGKY